MKYFLRHLCVWITVCCFYMPDAAHAQNSTPPVTEPADRRPAAFATDSAFLDYIQKVHLNYMWDGAEKHSGLALERIHPDGKQSVADTYTVTTGGSGFGIAGLLTGIHRGLISRKDGVKRLTHIVDFLEKADRFHGIWPHWLDGRTGKVLPFSKKDDGGDLVESCFLMQGLLCVRQYFRDGNKTERRLCKRIDRLWREMDFDFYRNGKDVLYWHWSPRYGWEMNFPLEGYNEALIVYILAASSPTHGIPASAYHKGWARGGNIRSDAAPYGLPLLLKHNGAEQTGGPLFWAHYSFIGLNPFLISDRYADYRTVTVNHALSNYRYCVDNPKHYKGYGKDCWGLTASYSTKGYAGHAPGAHDLGVISPTAALSSFPYTPEESMCALKGFYAKGEQIWGKYGFFDAFSQTDQWAPARYLAIDQCTIAPMIENYRSALLWNLFMSCPEIQEGLKKLGFSVASSPAPYSNDTSMTH